MKIVRNASLMALAALLGACAGSVKENLSPEERVRDRAGSRYEAFMDKSPEGLAKALSYTTPSFRSVNNERDYSSRYGGRGMWLEANVEKIVCEESVCDVNIKLKFKTPRVQVPITSYLSEKWIEIDGEWWVYHK